MAEARDVGLGRRRRARWCAGRSTRLDSVVSWLAGVPGRKAILYVSDGLPLVPGLDLFTIFTRAPESAAAGKRISEMVAQRFDLTTRFREVTSHASRNRIAFYPIEAYGTRDRRAAPLFDDGRPGEPPERAALPGRGHRRAGRCSTPRTCPAALARMAEDFADLLLARLPAAAAGRRGGAQDRGAGEGPGRRRCATASGTATSRWARRSPSARWR